MAIASSGAGHGGRKTGSAWMDPGAVGNGYNEADLTRKINAKIIAATGVLDTTDNVATTVNGNINNIAANINRGPDGWALSSHLNSFKEPTATGVEVLYGSKDSAAMAAKVSAAIAKVLGITDRGAKDGTWLGIANGSNAGKKVLLIEWGFVSNPNDMKVLNAKMDEAVAAMLAVFGYSSSTSNKPTPTPAQPETNNTLGGLEMYIYWQPQAKGSLSDAYAVWGNKRFYLPTMARVNHFKNLVKDMTGKECREYRWPRGSDQIKNAEASTDLSK